MSASVAAALTARPDFAKPSAVASTTSDLGARALEQQIADYERETARLQEQLDFVGILGGIRLADTAAGSALQELAASASELQLLQPTEASMTAAWAQLACEEMGLAAMQLKVDRQSSVLTRTLRHVQQVATSLQQSLAAAAAEVNKKQAAIEGPLSTTLHDFQAKYEKYKSDIERCRHIVERNGFTKQIGQSALVSLSRQCDELQEELVAQKAALAKYQDLPPSQLSAELVVRQAQEELESLRAKLRARMAWLD